MGENVYGLSRTEVTDCKHKIFDLSILSDDTYSKVLEDLLEGQKYFDLVILNAGILGNIQKFNDVSMNDLDNIMNTNVFSTSTFSSTLGATGSAAVSNSSFCSERFFVPNHVIVL